MNRKYLDELKQAYPDKFASENRIFKNIRRGDRIFISTACGEPQYLIQALINYVESHPSAFFDAEVFHVWSLGVAPYADVKFKDHFRYNSFFVGDSTRNAVNEGLADYSPIFLSQIPDLFYRHLVPIDVALIQTSLPDAHGYMSLGISVDITKAAAECARLVIVQINANMPRTHGDSYIHMDDIDFAIAHDEPLLEFRTEADDEVAQEIGKYVARLIQDGDTIQVGYGSIPNAIMNNLYDKKHLGVHTELLSDGLVKLIKAGVVDNSQKTVNRGQTIATFCMGSKETYEFLHDNPVIKFQRVDYTNDPLLIAQQYNMTAINSALEIDLTGQASAESIGQTFYSGIGGQADFMRGAILAPGGKTIITLPSTAGDGKISRIAPFLKEGAGVTLNRGDVHYVVTEYGIAYLHGKNIRERAMELISIAHPKFRPKLIQEAKKLNLIYRDQAFIPGKRGEYPEELETYRTTKSGIEVFLRPVKISDEPRLKEFFYALSDRSLYRRFMSVFQRMPHEKLQEFVVIDYTTDMVIVAILEEEGKETLVGVGQYGVHGETHTAEAAFAVRDDYQGLGIGKELVAYLTYLAQRQGLLGFTAEVLQENRHMLHLFETAGFDLEKRIEEGVYQLKMMFRGT
ncbi:MAG: GNAT family N-acetyltransferase [Anaerolineae bacterium]|nr:GNAT family N-acetyltransferase [Anaerolineae bacterium]